MCLRLLSSSKRSIAEENIECYKIIVKKKYSVFNEYYTLSRLCRIKLGIKYYSEFEFGSERGFSKTIEKGLHSFPTLKNAKSFCQTELIDESFKYYIVKCFIPKGSEFYVGLFNNYSGYASNCIRYTNKIVYDHTEELKKINKIFKEILNN